MELLINDILKLGARRDRLTAKAFGGASMVEGLSDIGQANCDFTTDFLEREGISCQGKSLGGDYARHVMFIGGWYYPSTLAHHGVTISASS